MYLKSKHISGERGKTLLGDFTCCTIDSRSISIKHSLSFLLFHYLSGKYIYVCTFTQGSKGIRQWPMNLCTSSIFIHKITPSVDYK